MAHLDLSNCVKSVHSNVQTVNSQEGKKSRQSEDTGLDVSSRRQLHTFFVFTLP